MSVSCSGNRAGAPVFYLTEEHEHPQKRSTLLGFWLYLMSDCLVFAACSPRTACSAAVMPADPRPKDLFDLPLVAVNTVDAAAVVDHLWLRDARDAAGPRGCDAGLAGRHRACSARRSSASSCTSSAHMIHEGAGPQRSAFLSVILYAGRHARPARDLRPRSGCVTLMAAGRQHGLIPANGAGCCASACSGTSSTSSGSACSPSSI